jgi:hypothetical protein
MLYELKEINKDCNKSSLSVPTPNAMLDVWWLLVKSHVKDGAGWLPNCISGKSADQPPTPKSNS